MAALELLPRYEPLGRLGKGGGGEVWAVRDRFSGARFALKVLSEDASSQEMHALVREAVALSGLEGFGVPRVLRFGRLPSSGRAYMVRELVEGESLDTLIERGAAADVCLGALAGAADQLTLVHRAGLLHGDVKPANVIVDEEGRATLVDLGLAAPWREGGAPAEGLTPRYAAPELFEGGALTVRAEVYALGAALAEIVASTDVQALGAGVPVELGMVATRAMAQTPDERFPSVDEFASALRRAAGRSTDSLGDVKPADVWPVLGMDGTAGSLLAQIRGLAQGGVLRIVGPPGSGKSALLRRAAWSLGVEGTPIAWIDDSAAQVPATVEAELAAHSSLCDVIVLVDDIDSLDDASSKRLTDARAEGARLVVVGQGPFDTDVSELLVPPLETRVAGELVRRAIPSLTERLKERVVAASGQRPGELRRLVRLIASEAVASEADIECLIGVSESLDPPADDLHRVAYLLDRGRYNDAKVALAGAAVEQGRELEAAVARARLEIVLGESQKALFELDAVTPQLKSARDQNLKDQWQLYRARAHIGIGKYEQAQELAEALKASNVALEADSLACQGLSLSLLGRHDEARVRLNTAVEKARSAGSSRVEALALLSLAFALQRNDRLEEARAAYESAITAAERCSDAGSLAQSRLNLAGLLKVGGDIAGAIEHFEGAVDMGRRSGRRSVARQAMLDLANCDLYLGRIARARTSIEALAEQRDQLPPRLIAQHTGLEAELSERTGQVDQAIELYRLCAARYEALGQVADAAEARLTGVLVAARERRGELSELSAQLNSAEKALGEAPAHRPLLLLAQARLAALGRDERLCRRRLDEALVAAREARQREWVWRSLEQRAEVEDAGGQPLLARRDREEALAMLEEIGALLPRDLREVYWNDPRRRELRAKVQVSIAHATTEHTGFSAARLARPASGTSVSTMTSTPLEQRLARILEINGELAVELDVSRLTGRIIDHAVALSGAERGFVLLARPDGSLSVHASRSRAGEADAEFSTSIARRVIDSGEPVVSLSAQDDARMAGYASVHQLMVQSVACLPILGPRGAAVGALYLETRLRAGRQFERELPTLRAFADQAAIALENTRLVTENVERAEELEQANAELEDAQRRLRELLGERTERLKQTRRKLRDARETLYGHFGYQGLVGTSAAMRRVYALIERVRGTDIPVLITGESGTGKEVVARAIHSASERGKNKFLGVNCGAIPEHLLEGELFGHMRGAFTGADRDRKGLFREAAGGSILLDEIGEMPARMQAGLLRVLQEHTVRPVGGKEEEPVDVRLIFATNRDLGKLVEARAFREDLYYRIHIVELHLPALRERSEDIPQLVDHFLGIFAARYKRDRKSLSRQAMRRLTNYDWPGNVRQLEHVLLNAWVLSDRPELEAEDFDMPDNFAPRSALLNVAPARPARGARKSPGDLGERRQDERERILKALEASNWNRVRAAEISGIPRRTFYRRLREYGIQ